MENQNIVSTEKQHGMAWIVFSILLWQFIILIPVYFATLYWVIGPFVKSGVIENMSSSDMQSIYFYFGVFLFLISLIGVWWGCKFVAKRTIIQDGDLTKIGYWVGLIPFVIVVVIGSGLLVGAGVFGIFVTPRYIKKWLLKYKISN